MGRFVGLFAGICAAVSLLGSYAKADQIILQPGPTEGKDIYTTSVFSYAPGGGGPGGGLDDDTLVIGGWGDTYISLLEFDLNSAPVDAMSATLLLYPHPTYLTHKVETGMYLERITEFWDWRTQGTGSDKERLWWADRPSATALSGPLPAPSPGEWYIIDVTEPYNAWQSGLYPNYGLQLRPTSISNRFSTFVSSDYELKPCLRPMLVINGENAPPIADAGEDAAVDEGALATLDGSCSLDLQGDALNFTWTQLAGPPVTLDLSDPVYPTFIAPYVADDVTLTFQLVVDDGSDVSDPATVNITVVNLNDAPVADAGDNATIKEGAVGQLDGTSSYDPESAPITYFWSQVAGPAVALQPDATVAQPSFTAPFGVGQQMVFKLVVDDGLDASIPSPGLDTSEADTVAVAIVENSTPFADAGPNQTREEGSTVMLNGTGSGDSDVDDSLSYLWSQVSGTVVVLDDPASATPSFGAPTVAAGGEELVFALVVTDDDPVNPKSSALDEVSVHLLNINDPPRCDLAVASSASLWPPAHKMVEIGIDGVSDEDSEFNSVSLYIDGVTQDEPVNGLGDGDSEPDAVIQRGDQADRVLLRAERSGTGDGRIYEIAFTATDGFESCQGYVTVSVPHSRKSDAIESGQAYDSSTGG